jgi:hypothetical protein
MQHAAEAVLLECTGIVNTPGRTDPGQSTFQNRSANRLTSCSDELVSPLFR